MRMSLVASLLLFVGSVGAEPPHSTITGRKVQLEPSKVTFEVPAKWLEWHAQFKNNLHLSREQLKKVEHGAGEWDTEYGKIVNAVLPFEQCAVHVGGEGWGRDGVSFVDVQLRVYTGDWTPEALEKLVLEKGVPAAKQVSKTVTSETRAEDKRVRIRAALHYGDYGATANIDFHIRRSGKLTLVLVCMFVDSDRKPDKQIEGILNSVMFP